MSDSPGESQIYESVNQIDEQESSGFAQIPVEFVRSIELAALPPATLNLKVGMHVMIMRNVFEGEGLCNGARGVLTRLHRTCGKLELMGGDFNGNRVFIPRIKLFSGDKDLPYILSRKQPPIKPCFAMAINKGQGQSFEKVGIDLRTAVFTHGQFYVAASRVTTPQGLYVLLLPDTRATDNVVFPEVLQGLG